MKKNINIKTKMLKPLKKNGKEKIFDPLNFMSAQHLKSNVKFPPLNWIVSGILSENNLSILSSAPKLGKSWWALDVSVQVALGLQFMKKFKTIKSSVLYLAFEDPPRRIQSRLKIILGKKKAPSNLFIYEHANNFPRLNDGGIEALTKIVKKRPDIKLIIIDTFARFTKRTSARSDYKSDVDLLSPLHELVLANKGLCILLIHHTRKTAGNTVQEEILGSMGVLGTPDTLLVMKKTNGKVVLHVEGRDLMSNQYEIEFIPELGRWEVIGSGLDTGLTKSQKRIIAFLKKKPKKTYTAKTICDATNDTTEQNVTNKLKRLVIKGLVISPSKGDYKLSRTMVEKLNDET